MISSRTAFAVRSVGLGRCPPASLAAPARRLARHAGGGAAPAYTLHTYDHCPFCNRVEILLGRFGIPYERVVYGYGEGAVPEACGGTGYNPEGGPVALTGKKMLPVLEGPDVPAADGARGMPESLEICSYLIAKHGLVAPCDSGRGDLGTFRAELREIAGQLIKPREIKMPVKDWADPRDAAYAKWKYTTKAGFDYEAAEAATPELLAKVNAKLKELVPMIRGTDSLNVWGWGMDDVVLLPDLRRLTCVKGVVFPEEVVAYMDASLKNTQLSDYSAVAC
uniref:GST N-terminal domain-containing protein n=2 Tax=Alexandrium monilatum TaxID=311494 RepID=A0A7S4QPC7_9DINO|mmetsp:Transcript_109134/g.326401  ORF Transcript_109134/g.326401 Transcript_109134/m.326401 type:complete len:279 (-) Transcript_109134:23-859(-)